MLGRNRTTQEASRPLLQAGIYDSLTRRLVTEAGIRGGMRVLDIGSGPGAVSKILSAFVGPTGAVVGVEHDAAMVEIAQCHAGAANVTFICDNIETMDLVGPFDAIVGRFVLRELKDATRALRRLSRLLIPGGIIAFQEKVLAIPVTSFPELSLIERARNWMDEARRRARVEITMGTKLATLFVAAGLPAPALRFEAPVGQGPDWLGYAYLAESLRSMLSAIEWFRIASKAEIGVETLEQRMRSEATEAGAVLILTPCIGAWTQVRTPSQNETLA